MGCFPYMDLPIGGGGLEFGWVWGCFRRFSFFGGGFGGVGGLGFRGFRVFLGLRVLRVLVVLGVLRFGGFGGFGACPSRSLRG